MYIVLTIDSTNFTFQKKDEAGADIGAAEVYAKADYRITEVGTAIQIEDHGGPIKPFPPKASYPRQRTILINS